MATLSGMRKRDGPRKIIGQRFQATAAWRWPAGQMSDEESGGPPRCLKKPLRSALR